MKISIAAAFALILAIAVGAVGYAVGVRTAPDREAIAAMVAETVAGRAPAPMASVAPATDVAVLSDEQQREVEGIIRNYLLTNPEIIRDAINELQRKEDAAAEEAKISAIATNKEALFSSARQVVLGNPNGDVTLVEFFDYNCSYCKRAHADMKQLIADDPNLRFVLKEFPILGEGSVEAAQIAVAVLMTDASKYSDFHDALLSEQGGVDGAKALAVAESLGLDPEALKVTAASEEAKANISEVRGLANQLNLTGTPSYVTANAVVIGAVGIEELKLAISSARECATTATC